MNDYIFFRIGALFTILFLLADIIYHFIFGVNFINNYSAIIYDFDFDALLMLFFSTLIIWGLVTVAVFITILIVSSWLEFYDKTGAYVLFTGLLKIGLFLIIWVAIVNFFN